MGKLKLMGRDPVAATLLGWLMLCDPSHLPREAGARRKTRSSSRAGRLGKAGITWSGHTVAW